MGSLIPLIIYGVMAAAAAGIAYKAWTGFTGSYIAQGKQQQIKIDQPKIDAAEAVQKQAEADRDTARGNSARCEKALEDQKAGQAETDRQTKINFAAAKALREEQVRRAAANAAQEADLKARSAAAPKLMACEQERDLAKSTLRETLKARRGQPPATPAVPK